MDGWAPQPWNERYGGQLLVSFTRTPAEVGGFLQYAIGWVNTHHTMRVGARPLVLLESWNELGEGSYVMPTNEDGYAYGQAVASALGLPWNAVHTRHFVLKTLTRQLVAGALVVDDGWSPCDVAGLTLQRRTAHGWVASAPIPMTKSGGSFSLKLPKRTGTYRLRVSQTTRYEQTCAGTTSTTFRR